MMKRDDKNNTIVEQLGSVKVNINTKIGCLCIKTNIGQYPKQSMYIEKIEHKVSSSLKNPYNLNHKSKVYIMELKVKQSSYAPI